MVNEYFKAMKYIYGKRPHISIRDNVFHVNLTSSTIFKNLAKLANFGLKTWSLPNFKVNGTKEAWLRAFFSAEGYVSEKTIRVQTVNKKGMLSISKLLNELCIEHRYYEYKPKKINYSPVSIICILKKDARTRFLKNIGFWHSKKERKLKKALNL